MRRVWCCCELICVENLPLHEEGSLWVNSVANSPDFTRRPCLKTAYISHSGRYYIKKTTQKTYNTQEERVKLKRNNMSPLMGSSKAPFLLLVYWVPPNKPTNKQTLVKTESLTQVMKRNGQNQGSRGRDSSTLIPLNGSETLNNALTIFAAQPWWHDLVKAPSEPQKTRFRCLFLLVKSFCVWNRWNAAVKNLHIQYANATAYRSSTDTMTLNTSE